MASKSFNVVFCVGDRRDSEKFYVTSVKKLKKTILQQWVKILNIPLTQENIMVKIENRYGDLEDINSDALFEAVNLETYVVFDICVYPFGQGVGTNAGKKPLIETFQVYTNKCFADIKEAIKNMGKIYDEFVLVRNDSNQNMSSVVGVTTVEEFLKGLMLLPDYRKVIYAMNIHSSYCNIVFPQIKERLEFPQSLALQTLSADHHKHLTNITPDIAINISSAISEAKKKFPLEGQVVRDAVDLAVKMLQLVCDNTAPKESFNEKIRRTIIDIPLHVTLGIINQPGNVRRELMMEESVYTDNASGIRNPTEIIGSGQLDYMLPEGIVITTGSHDEQQANESEVSEEFPFTEIEAKIDVSDKYLYQLLAQLHDCLYVHEEFRGAKRTLQGDILEKKLIYGRERAFGILCTGHTWEVYSIVRNPAKSKNEVFYHGKRQMKVLRYLQSTTRTSSFKVALRDGEYETARIVRSEVEEVIYLILAVLTNCIPSSTVTTSHYSTSTAAAAAPNL